MTRRALLLINRHARRGKQAFAQAIDLLSNTETKSALVIPAFELAGFDITTTKVPR